MEETNIQTPQSCSHGACRHHCMRSPRRIVKIVALFVLVVAVFVWLDKGFRFSAASDTERSMKNKVQAVFLSNGQVYFGILSRSSFDAWRLTNVHYLEKSQVPAEEGSSEIKTQTAIKKLTQDMHAPEDAMYIPNKNILFWQNLQNASPITQAIASGK